MANKKKPLKKQKIRNSEYYDMQLVLDELYAASVKGQRFCNLVELIKRPENIKLAYRNIRKNSGSRTAGVDNKTISDLNKWNENALVAHVQRKLDWYIPNAVRRVEIPKDNGKTRPLGIPTMMDRLIQQCILQVLEPICEAKFFKRSNGFRPNHSAENAIAQAERMIQNVGCHYVIDIDIKSFFDDVNHGKLLKQMWTLGIRDKKLLSIISAMLKAEVAGIGFPEKGTPQGGIISPLLSNIVLNELDWWIVSQWEEMPTQRNYVHRIYANGTPDKSSTFRTLRNYTNLKECYVVRYADDFKIFCRDYGTAKKTYTAVVKWLKERLSLEISEEKSGITNLKKNYMEFLGIKIRAVSKSGKYAVRSHMTDKAKEKAKKKAAESIKRILNHNDQKSIDKNISLHNSLVSGLHNYYKMATHISADFAEIGYPIQKKLNGANHNNKGCQVDKSGEIRSRFIAENYGKSSQMRWIGGRPLIPIAYVQHDYPKYKRREVNKYVLKNYEEHQVPNSVNFEVIRYLMENAYKWESIEFADNMLSRYIAQKGNCAITHKPLYLHNMECHHIKPRLGGRAENNSYSNLIILCTEAHRLVTATNETTIRKYVQMLKLNEKQLAKLNKLRKYADLQPIEI